MSQSLPPKPSLEHLKKQAKSLLDAHRSGEIAAIETVTPYFPSLDNLAQAQLVIARTYGFSSWTKLSRYVEGRDHPLDEFLEAALAGHNETAKSVWSAHRETLRLHPAAAAAAADVEALRDLLTEDPSLANRSLPPKDRPLLGYLCFSRMLLDKEFEGSLIPAASLALERGSDPNGFYMAEWGGESYQQTPLYGAAGYLNHAGLTKLLLDSGADPNENEPEVIPYRGEALYHACDFPGHNDCLRLLLEAGVHQPARDYCLLRKLDFEDPYGVLAFLKHGANPNNGRPRTALTHAILRNRSQEMLRLLIENGSDPAAPNIDGTNAYIIARRLGNHGAAELFESFGVSPELSPYDQILAAAAENNAEAVKALALSHPEALQSMKGYGRQPEDGAPLGHAGDILHDLARQGQTEGLRALLELGMDAGTLNDFRETPLHWAGVAGNAAAAKLLLDHGAPLDVRERNHNADPLGYACWGSVNWKNPIGDYAETVRVMLDAGAVLPENVTASEAVLETIAHRNQA